MPKEFLRSYLTASLLLRNFSGSAAWRGDLLFYDYSRAFSLTSKACSHIKPLTLQSKFCTSIPPSSISQSHHRNPFIHITVSTSATEQYTRRKTRAQRGLVIRLIRLNLSQLWVSSTQALLSHIVLVTWSRSLRTTAPSQKAAHWSRLSTISVGCQQQQTHNWNCRQPLELVYTAGPKGKQDTL